MQQFEAEPDAPEIEATPPAKLNYMPHAAAIGAKGIEHEDLGLHGRGDLRGRLGPRLQGRQCTAAWPSSAAPPRCVHVTDVAAA